MSDMILAGLAKSGGSGPSLVRLLTNNLDLALISVVRTTSSEIGGAYDQGGNTAIVLLPEASFQQLRTAVGGGQIVDFALTYQTPECNVTGFVFSPQPSDVAVKGNGIQPTA